MFLAAGERVVSVIHIMIIGPSIAMVGKLWASAQLWAD